jgi:hypothetical protein
MAITDLGLLGTGSGTTAGTGLTITNTTGAVILAGTLVAGDLVIGSVSFENSAQMTADADTLNGTWDAIVGTFTTGGAAATNVGTGTQDKVVTATGAQTFNPTGGVADTVACVYSLVPFPDPTITQAAYRFYAAAATEGGTLADGYDETNVSVSSSAGTAGADYGQSFLGNGGRLSRARFWMSKTVAPTGNVTARLYAHTGTFGVDGTGTGSPLATATSRPGTSLQSTARWEYFDFDGTFTLAAGTSYVIALTIDSIAGGAVSYGQDNTTPTHAGIGSSRTTGAWFTVPAADMIFGVYSDSDALAAQNTAYTADLSTGDANLQLRTRLQSTNISPIYGTDDFQLQYERNASGTWVNVAAGASGVVPYDSANLTDGAATTNRLGVGTGSFTAGKVSEDGLVDNLGWPGNNNTELLYALTLKQTDLANGDTLRFRVLRNGVTTGLTYTQVPTIPVTKTAAAAAARFQRVLSYYQPAVQRSATF